ncbi:MAG: hypothetical protein ACRDLP_16845 [Solirubrobacteraceae bacterium]
MVLSRSRILAPAVAVTLALVAILTGARGVDLAAATYRVELFARSGLTLWDSQWYGGHWTFDYSVLFAPIGWIAGIPLMEITCVAIASWAVDRLAVARFGRAGRAGAVAFAVGTVVQVAIGQEPYLLGETLGIVALVAMVGRHRVLAVLLAVASALASPLTGGFVAMIAAAWFIASWPERRWDLVAFGAAGGVPVVAVELLFPGQGVMPFPTLNFFGMMLATAPVFLVALRRHRVIAVGAALYALSLVFAYAVPSAIGNNITRLGISFGLALVVSLASQVDRRGRALLAVAAVPFALAQWVPAVKPLLGLHNPSLRASYFQPLLGFLGHADRPLGRVEVVPTAYHWEAAYVAVDYPLARGWERQLDTANNAIFYQPGLLTRASYRHWLFANGVRFVALPDVQLDYAALAEGRLVRVGIPGLRLVWHNQHWRVYSVVGAPGVVSGPARLVSLSGSDVVIDVARPGTIVVRERYEAAWRVARGHASVTSAPGGWLRVRARRAGAVELRISL